jgi:DNA primase
LDYNQLSIGYCGYEIGKSWEASVRHQAEKMGLFKIRNCLIFPTKDIFGQIVSIYGRSISSNPRTRHFYLTGGFRGLYPAYPKVDSKQIILTESIIDAATIRQHVTEIPVLALYGTNGFTKEHGKCLTELPDLEEVILFFDGDEAGRAAVKKYVKQLQVLLPAIKISEVKIPEGEDANSLIIGHNPEILQHVINERTFLFSTEKKDDSIENKKLPEPPRNSILNTDNAELLLYDTPEVHITILGGIKITGLDRLRVTLKIEKREYTHHLPIRHSLDLYHAKQVDGLTQKMAEQLELVTATAEKIISELTGALEDYRQQKLELLKPKKVEKKSLSPEEKAVALAYLKNPKLLRNTLNDIAGSGIIGEVNNSLIAYLCYTSRKREKPLHIMCLGASGTGKTYLQEKVSELIPEDDKIEITSLSDNAFYYFGREELKGKLILIEDLDGAENVLYPLRELQTKRRITKTVTLKDNKGNLKTITLRVEGPVCVSGCTTKEHLYEDNANRSILLYIDDSREQDKRIMTYQKEVSSGEVRHREEEKIKEQIKNVQQLLRPIKVVNPYAKLIDLPEDVFKPRRTLLLLLSFIETITFYHQYQRKIKTDPQSGEQYIETTRSDVEAAFVLMKEILFSKSDELSKAGRKFLERLKNHVKDGEVFYARDIRKTFRMSSSSVHRYVRELKVNGYIEYKGGNRYRGFEYQIADYKEYEKLKNTVDDRLDFILESIPVSQAYPTPQNGIQNTKKTS